MALFKLSHTSFDESLFKSKANVINFPQAYNLLKGNVSNKSYVYIPPEKYKLWKIKRAFEYSFKQYSKYCWGEDEINPISGSCNNCVNSGLTIIDSLTTHIIMGTTTKKIMDYVKYDFKLNGEWSVFEVIIRYLGSFLSAYELTGENIFLHQANKIGKAILEKPYREKKLLPHFAKFTSENGKMTVEKISGPIYIAEISTFQLEFFTLGMLTNNSDFIDYINDVNKAFTESMKSSTEFYSIESVPGVKADIGAGFDSYYEYLVKSYLLFRDGFKPNFEKHQKLVNDISEKLAVRKNNKTYIGYLSDTGFVSRQQHLASFIGATIAIGSIEGNDKAEEHLQFAKDLVDTFIDNYESYPAGLGPDIIDFGNEEVVAIRPAYDLRPEVVESIYFLWKATGDPKYRKVAWKIFKNIEKYCKKYYGYSSLSNVYFPRRYYGLTQESFFLSETLKYLYLIFQSNDFINTDEWVFNTEAHPLHVFPFKGVMDENNKDYKNLVSFLDLRTKPNSANDSNNETQKAFRNNKIHKM